MTVWAESLNALKLHLVSGQHVICLLDDQPVVTFCSEELVLTTHMCQMSYQASEVLKFTYEQVESESISQIQISQIVFSFRGNTLNAKGMEPESEITITSIDGSFVASAQVSDEGTVSVDLPKQAGMVCVVNTKITNFKITKP